MIDRSIFFDLIRDNPFPGTLNQSQVNGISFILDVWENGTLTDLRWLSYAFATTMWETSSEMQPIEEYGKGSGQSYGKKDPQTGQTYYGRGFVQLTWRDNYARADAELGLEGGLSCEWHAENALDPTIAGEVMFRGMEEGWFRQGNTFAKYFSDTKDDPFNAREIINGDKNKVPTWSGGVKVGNLIAGYHRAYLDALDAATIGTPEPAPPEPVVQTTQFLITVTGAGPFTVTVEPVADT